MSLSVKSRCECYAQSNLCICSPVQQIPLSICCLSGITLHTWDVLVATQAKISPIVELTFWWRGQSSGTHGGRDPVKGLVATIWETAKEGASRDQILETFSKESAGFTERLDVAHETEKSGMAEQLEGWGCDGLGL